MNFHYKRGRHELMVGVVDWIKDDIRALLYDAGHYTPDPDHKSLGDVPKPARVVEARLTGRRFVHTTELAADADDVSFTNLAEPRSAEGLIIYKRAGPLLVHIDSNSGFPVALGPHARNTVVRWSDDAARIFSASFVYQAAHCVTLDEIRPTVDKLHALMRPSRLWSNRRQADVERLIRRLHERVHVKPPELS